MTVVPHPTQLNLALHEEKGCARKVATVMAQYCVRYISIKFNPVLATSCILPQWLSFTIVYECVDITSVGDYICSRVIRYLNSYPPLVDNLCHAMKQLCGIPAVNKGQ